MAVDESVFIHPLALVESDTIGAGTRIWAFTHVMKGVPVGESCNISDFVAVETGAFIGNRVTIKPYVVVSNGVVIEDDAFIGPGVILPNDLAPRSPRMAEMPEVTERYKAESKWLKITRIGRGASLGTGALIAPGLIIGDYAMVTMGAVVTKDVPPQRLVAGVPARGIGWACLCGIPLERKDEGLWICPECGRKYSQSGESIQLLDS